VKTRNRRRSPHEETRRTVIVAGAANILVGVVKLAAGILSGSSAMLAEAAHSAADTLDQLFLLTSLRQADRPADDDHPFGHGQERYFWSLLAAFGIFIAGAGFSFFEGILALKSTSEESPLWAYIALAVSVIAEGTSFIRAYSQVRKEARDSHEEVFDHVSASPDITVKVALFEDSAAVVGLIFAALGVGLTQLTGSNMWNGIGSIAIGLLLIVVAFKLGLDSKELLVGRAANGPTQTAIREIIEGEPGVDELLDLRTMQIGPDSLIVAAKIALNDDQSADQTEDLADNIDKKLGEKLTMQVQVYIDPTQTRKSSPPAPQPSSTPAAGPRTS
jgi:cation diffusion facilitator family transporter